MKSKVIYKAQMILCLIGFSLIASFEETRGDTLLAVSRFHYHDGLSNLQRCTQSPRGHRSKCHVTHILGEARFNQIQVALKSRCSSKFELAVYANLHMENPIGHSVATHTKLTPRVTCWLWLKCELHCGQTIECQPWLNSELRQHWLNDWVAESSECQDS